MNKITRILLAEDDPNDVELTLEALADYNLVNDVAVVNDGQEALDYLYRKGKYKTRFNENPLVILLDLKMPKVDGLEVLKQIKKDPNLKTIPVVILTSSNMEKDLIESYNLGANAYVMKPVAFHEFVDAVKTLGKFWVLTNKQPSKSVK